jgi:hypothetical protein
MTEYVHRPYMASILDDPRNRVRLLRAGSTGAEIEWLATHVFDTNLEILGVNWLPEQESVSEIIDRVLDEDYEVLVKLR